MFRRILQRTPGRVGSQSSDSDSSAVPGNAVDVNNESSSEGFICPVCMKMCVTATDLSEHYQEHVGIETRRLELRELPTATGFICPLCMKSHGSAEELFKHYEAVHESGIDTSQGRETNMSPNRDDVTLLRQEVQDLQASLKEERWYSEELKKELEKVQGQRQQESKPDGLETAASTELESLEQQLEESHVENFNIKQMKDLFEQKAAQLATEIVDLKAKYDEETSLRQAAEQKVASLTQELQKERGVCEDLKTELLQRPGVEDVAVLKKELVQVQMLMDKMTLEREKESEKLKDECNHLRAECSTSETTINQLRAELAKGPQEVAVYVRDLQRGAEGAARRSGRNSPAGGGRALAGEARGRAGGLAEASPGRGSGEARDGRRRGGGAQAGQAGSRGGVSQPASRAKFAKVSLRAQAEPRASAEPGGSPGLASGGPAMRS